MDSTGATRLDPTLWSQFVELGHPRGFSAESIIFGEGTAPSDVYGIVSGRVRVTALARDGREITMGHKGPQELFGELSAFDGLPRSASAIAIDDVAVIAVARTTFNAFVADNPAVGLSIIQLLVDRLRSTTADHTALRAGSVDSRLAAGLITLAGREGTPAQSGATRIEIRHIDLANWLGVNREAVSRGISKFTALGLVEAGRGTIDIVDIAGLRKQQ